MSDWVTKALGEVATLQRGNDLPLGQRNPGKYAVIGANGPVGVHDSSVAKGPGITVGRSGSVGKVTWSEDDFWPLNTTLWVKNFHGNEPRFVYRLLEWLDLRKYSEGAGVPTLNRNLLHPLEVGIPPINEQKRIAAVLDKADALRRHRQESLQLTEKLLQSVFLEMFGSELEPTCPRVKLADHLDFLTSGGRGWAKYYSTAGDKFIRSMDVRMNEISDSDMVCVSAPKNAEAERTRVRTGDVLLTITGSLIGRVAPVTAAHAGSYVSQHVAILRTHGFSPEFIAWSISTDEGQRQIQKHQTGQTKPGLNFDQIRRITIPRPTPDLEEKFVQLIRKRLGVLADQRSSVDQAKAFFSTLQQRAFRGELALSRLELGAAGESPAIAPAPEPIEVRGRYTRPGCFIAPPEIEAQMMLLEAELDQGPGDSIAWSEDFFKYRILSQIILPPFSFDEIWEAVQYDMPEAEYDTVRKKVFEYLEQGILEQQFDAETNGIVFWPHA